ncbi:MAG: alpha/beta hydrolase family protein [Acidimicrobiia bacterium]
MEDSQVDTPHGEVPVSLYGSRSNAGGVMLVAPGAGAGRTHPWIVGIAQRLADAGAFVVTFDYAYRAAGRKAPDRLPKLLDVHESVATWCGAEFGPVTLAGKSMGGRVGGHLASERDFGAAGLVYLGYPLVALGKTDPRPTDHLLGLVEPQLFVSGSRDRMGPIDLISDLAAAVPNGALAVAEGGDHSFVPLKSSGRTVDDALDYAGGAVTAWVADNGIPTG